MTAMYRGALFIYNGPTHAGHMRTGRDDFCRSCEAAGDAERRNVAAVACARAHAWSMASSRNLPRSLSKKSIRSRSMPVACV
eukprot:scaffold65488_cov87-Phaeocystis_antarctica.AAC.4